MREKVLPYFLIVVAFFLIFSLIATRVMLKNVETEVNRTSRMVALLLSQLIVPATESPEASETLNEVLRDIDFPIIITDELGIPRIWRNIEQIEESMNFPKTKPSRKNPGFIKALRLTSRLRKIHAPIPIKYRGKVVGFLYYGMPKIVTFLQIFPVLLLILGVISILVILWAAKSFQDYTFKDFWASFAKGLAHQMGVPVSSLFGWFELLKNEGVDPEILKEVEKDLKRLASILRRFSKIGGSEKLEPINLGEVVRETLKDLKTRFLKDIDVEFNILSNVQILGDKELIQWAIENMLKNSYEARRKEGAKIRVILKREDTEAVLIISDNGQGIPKDKVKYLFRRSFTTKEKGWGAGLLLVRRIVEDIHHGKIRLVKSVPEVETTFELRFPAV